MRVHYKKLFLIAAVLSVAQLPLAGSAEENSEVSIVSVVLRPLQAAEVPAQQTGLLKKISVEEGQHVEENEILATLDPLEAYLAVVRARLERAQAEKKANNQISIQYAVKALEVAEAELRRSRESIEKFAKSISQSQLDVERLTVEKLMLEKQQAEHEYANPENQIEQEVVEFDHLLHERGMRLLQIHLPRFGLLRRRR